MSASEKVPFLDFSQHEAALLQEKLGLSPQWWNNSWAWTCRQVFVIQLVLLSFYTAASIMTIRTYSKPEQPPRGLIDLHIKSEPHLYSTIHNNPFAGQPDPQIDASWHRLLEGINIRVSQKELAPSKQSSVNLPEGGGYLSWLGAYHEIHCLKIVRQWTYRDYYFPNLTAEEKAHEESHSDHCIEYLRQAAMCHGDTSLTVFKWDETKSKPVLDPHRSPHMCIDWDELNVAVKDRAISHEELDQLQNPLQQMIS